MYILPYLSHMKLSEFAQVPLEPERRPRLLKNQILRTCHPIITLKTGITGARPGWSHLRESVKLTVRARINSEATRKWIPYWNSSLLLTQLANAQPGVLKKIYRPYLSARLDCKQRLKVLTSHYDFIAKRGLGALVLRAALRPVQLAEISGKSGSLYQLEFVAMGEMEREGELVLQLLTEGVVIYSVAFTFFTDGVTPLLAIGCMQGGRSDDALQKIGFATRDMFGLRPKSLMARLVHQIGCSFGCRDLLLVGNANRVMHQQIRKGRVSADYNETWSELGAVRQDDGDFLLPCAVLTEPDLATIASSKRSAAKKRFALLSGTSRAVCTALETRSAGFTLVSNVVNVPKNYQVPASRALSPVPISLVQNSRRHTPQRSD